VTKTKLHLLVRADRIEVRFEHASYQLTRVIVELPALPWFSGVRIRGDDWKPFGAREIEVGDWVFDTRFFVEGPERLVVRMLDAEMRRLLLEAGSKGDLEIREGTLQVVALDHRLPEVLPILLELAQRFMRQSTNAAPGLAANARRDPEPGVRLRNLIHLARDFRDEQLTHETLRAACRDPSPQVRLQAGTALGAEGRDVLRELAEDAEGTIEDAISSLAVAALGAELPLERVQAILRRSLRDRRIQTARVCLERLGRSGDTTAVPTLAKILALEKDELAIAAAVALGITGDEAAEPPLIQALDRDDNGLGVAAANALAHIGSAASVLPLKEAARSGDQALRQAARQAVAEIQSRFHPGASPGQLSLAQAEAGQLSLATDPAGQLSLPPQEPEKGPGG